MMGVPGMGLDSSGGKSGYVLVRLRPMRWTMR